MDYRYVCFTEGVVICRRLSVHRTSILVHDRLLNATKMPQPRMLRGTREDKVREWRGPLVAPIEPKFRLQLDIFGVDRKRTQTGHFLCRACVVYAALQDRSRLEEDFHTVRCMGSFLVSLSWEILSYA